MPYEILDVFDMGIYCPICGKTTVHIVSEIEEDDAIWHHKECDICGYMDETDHDEWEWQ